MIIISYAGAGKEFYFSNFITGWERVEKDFGSEIKFEAAKDSKNGEEVNTSIFELHF